jgi:metal-sulfur cluster biosynthetic enzyme
MSEEVMSKEEGVREALRAVVDPEIGMNIIELGLIRNIEVGDDQAHITMIMTTPFCPYAPQLLELSLIHI